MDGTLLVALSVDWWRGAMRNTSIVKGPDDFVPTLHRMAVLARAPRPRQGLPVDVLYRRVSQQYELNVLKRL
jgi:hypothetical protein